MYHQYVMHGYVIYLLIGDMLPVFFTVTIFSWEKPLLLRVLKKVNSLAQLGTQIKLSQHFVSGMHIIEYMYLIEKGTCSHWGNTFDAGILYS